MAGKSMARPDPLAKRIGKRTRCAIYTRKSTEEGLEQAFNSLDAQREACAAFVLSQKHEGWSLLPARYDDGGFSGGNMERPALQRLLADIEAGQIDVIVVYKVDRLTRALADFAKLVEVFDRRGVSFVSITQQFNTTTSMGRLTLNILLSFAQFERELIGERVRDKIAASKKKGMWMGGTVPLGYDVKDRKLVINRDEAKTVVDIFRRYVRLKTVRALENDLAAAEIRTKQRYRPDGTPYGHERFSQGGLYLMLQNRTYRGEATHKGSAYPGEHAAIIDPPLWDAVQATFAANRLTRASGSNSKSPSLLTGKIFAEAGGRLTPTWSIKKGTRYRYYISTTLLRGKAANTSNRLRIPASDLEAVVISRLRNLLTDRGELLEAANGAIERRRSGFGPLMERARQISNEIDAQNPEQIKSIIAALIHRVEIHADHLTINVSRPRLTTLLTTSAVDPIMTAQSDIDTEDLLKLTAPIRRRRLGRELKLLVDDPTTTAHVDTSLVRLLARAHDIQSRLSQNPTLTVHDISRGERIGAPYIYILLRLAWLAPDIVTAIVNGRQPLGLNAMKLMRLTPLLPGDWSKQRTLLGFR
jgi:DNA invertase Pin-like site-specific DNA recombinase